MTGAPIFEARKPGRVILRAAPGQFNGARFLDIREWVAGDGEAIPTKRGVTIPLDRVGELGKALTAWDAANAPHGPPSAS